MLLRELLGKLGDDMGDVMIQIRKGRKNLDVHPMIKRDMIDALHVKLEELKRKGYMHSATDSVHAPVFPVQQHFLKNPSDPFSC